MTSQRKFYRSVVWLCDFIFRRYFREVSVTGTEHIPEDGGGVLVSWHPNGMIDPGLILTYFPRMVIFGARDGLFSVPVLGWLMKKMGAVPIYRSMDQGNDDPAARRARNAESLQALSQAVTAGGFACLFPEGDSHDAPHLIALKTGAARFFRQAWQHTPEGQPLPVLLPVGLHYQRKQVWRSRVLVAFHPPLTVPPPPAAAAPDAVQQEWDADVTRRIETSLQEVVHATESWEVHHLLHRVRLLVRAERAARAGAKLSGSDMAERTLGFARAWSAYNTRAITHPDEVAQIRQRVEAYVLGLRLMGIRDHELDHPPSLFRRGLVAFVVLKSILLFVILPPFILLGLVIHALPAGALWLASRKFSKRKKDVSSIKLLLGVLLFPLTWGLLLGGAYFVEHNLQDHYPMLPDQPVLAALAVLLLSIGGMVVALWYIELAQETLRSARIRLVRARRRSAVAHLKVERTELYDTFMELVEGLDLPGAVQPDGMVTNEDVLQGQPGWQR